jgi:putative ABC transport system permease protein
MPHVRGVQPTLQASFGVKNALVEGLFYGSVPQPGQLPPLVAAARIHVFPLAPGEVVLPARNRGANLRPVLGTVLVVQYTRQIAPQAGEPVSARLKVVGLYEPTYTTDGPSAAYASEVDVVRWAAARAGTPEKSYLSSVGYQGVNVIVDAPESLSAIQRALGQQGYQTISVQQRLSELPQQVELLRYLGYIVVALLILYSAVAGTALAGSFVRQRTREIGILKAIGFRRRRVLLLLTRELIIVGTVPAVAGVLLGNLASLAISGALAGRTVAGVPMPEGIGIPPLAWTAGLLVLPAAAVVVGGLRPARRAAGLPADAALREW